MQQTGRHLRRITRTERKRKTLLVSIIIPAYNSAATLPECLEACLAQDYAEFEIIVVDDGSTDDTAAAAGKFTEAEVLRQVNQGPAAARNHGARVANGEILAYTDADCIPRPDWLSRLVEGFTESVVAVGGTYACANPEFRLARVIQAEIAHRHARFGETVDFLGSFNVAFRAQAFHAAGGFDEGYRYASGEDNDLAYRLLDAGGRLRFAPRAVVAHYHPVRLMAYLRTQARHGYWRMKLYRDHPNRAGGDHYAGWPDLLAPPLGLVVAVALPWVAMSWGLGGGAMGITMVYATLVLLFAALHLPLLRRMRRELTTGDLLYFGGVTCLRDIARSLGLVRGVWTFHIPGWRT